MLNVITTRHSGEIVKPLLDDERTRKLSFTGSTEVGRTLIEQSARNVLRVSMELGGNAPFLVFADADLDKAVDGALLAKMRNIGEACTAANRFHVHESVAEEFTTRLAERMGKLRVGRGTEEGTDVGPLIDDTQRGKVAQLVEDAVAKGAKLVIGGQKLDGPGYFYAPTVLGDVPPMPTCCARRSSVRSPRWPPSPTTTRRSPPRTRPSTASSPTCSPRISAER